MRLKDNQNSQTLLVGVRIGTTILENNLAVSTDAKHKHLALTENICIFIKGLISMFRAALVQAKYWKQTAYLSTMEWRDKLDIFTLWETK